MPTWVNWGGTADFLRFKLPQALELVLEPGTTVGGVVQDPQGQPVAGALVYLSIADGFMLDGVPRPSLSSDPVKTDAQGRWTCDFAPVDLDSLSIRLDHPDFVSNASFRKAPPVLALRNRSAVMVMEPGVSVSGTVLDKDGRPIAGAQVRHGNSPPGRSSSVETTGAEGRFAFQHVAPGDVVLTVRAAGHAPELRRIRAGSRTPPVEFRLGSGRTIVGRVVDPEGKPLADVSVIAVEWPDYQNLLRPGIKSAADGGFRLTDEPADPVTLRRTGRVLWSSSKK